MHRDLLLGMLGVQAGFVTPEQVVEAVAAGREQRDERTLLGRLEDAGALTPARRILLEAMAKETLAAAGGDAQRAIECLRDVAVHRTLSDAMVPGDEAVETAGGENKLAIPKNARASTVASTSSGGAASRWSGAQSTTSSAARWR